MDSLRDREGFGPWIVPLEDVGPEDAPEVGGKAANLGRLARSGFRVPPGFCVVARAYEEFLAGAGLEASIRMELGRKPMDDMRWEELWDAALRVRTAFLAAEVPAPIRRAVGVALESIGGSGGRGGSEGPEGPWAVRSSAPGEDSDERSFAGLHESFVGVRGENGVLDAIRLVWASLWSDAALLYRKELALDPLRSRMAVLVQRLVIDSPSGVAFGRDPRDQGLARQVVEAVPGLCSDLVDGAVDPDRWILERATGRVVEHRRGDRPAEADGGPLLADDDLRRLHGDLLAVERLLACAPDVEWTGRGERRTLLQARPITSPPATRDDERAWYLSLRPSPRRLAALARKVTEDLIPALEADGESLAREEVEALDDRALAEAIRHRTAVAERWRGIYHDEFIPFAHGVRRLGTYYNDAVRPESPYEFVGLLRGQRMIAGRRNEDLGRLAEAIRRSAELRTAVARIVDEELPWEAARRSLDEVAGGEQFAAEFEAVAARSLDVAYGGRRLIERPRWVLASVLEMAASIPPPPAPQAPPAPERGEGAGDRAVAKTAVAKTAVAETAVAEPVVLELERKLLAAVGEDRRAEAEETLEVARVSWRLRDDDNVLLGRVESQAIRALQEAERRLRAAGRLEGPEAAEGDALAIAAALEGLKEAEATTGASPIQPDAKGRLVRTLGRPEPGRAEPPSPARAGGEAPASSPAERHRQIVGQPAAPGLATGRARIVRGPEDLASFRAGDVLVCDAIQPTMSHLVPLARAIVERRGGMLIHGAIIARELGIPCVNGVPRATEVIPGGEILTVDGHLGIVTVGRAEFDLELAGGRREAGDPRP